MAKIGEFSEKVRAMIWDRDGGQCVRCGKYLEYKGGGYNIHHRIARGMRKDRSPKITNASNGIVLCGTGTTGCHGWVGVNVAEAKLNGLIVHWAEEPNHVPLKTHSGWVYLTTEGVITPVKYEDLKGRI